MNIERWTSSKKRYKLRKVKYKKIKKTGGENMEAVAIKRSDSLKSISFKGNTKLSAKDKSFEDMIKCGEEVKKNV